MTTFSTTFGRNRAEELQRDVSNQFVVPLFYDQLRFHEQTKALVIVGGRGCGKTTLLNYHSHPTRFSAKRSPEEVREDLGYIGLYYRADTNFLAGLQGEEHSAAVYLGAFKHSLTYNIALEIVDSLESINQGPHRAQHFGLLDQLDLSHLKAAYGFDPGSNLKEFRQQLRILKAQLATWINNSAKMEQPIFLPPVEFLGDLIQALQEQLPYIKDSTFAVFIDEYENLLPYQKQFINGLLKHGRRPLLFNIASKRNGFDSRATAGPESLQEIHDYNSVDLESKLESGFELFAAELILFKLVETRPSLIDATPLTLSDLRSTDSATLERRRTDDDYRQRVMSAAQIVFPKLTEAAIAEDLLKRDKPRAKLEEYLREGLAKWKSKIPVESFIRSAVPAASIVAAPLLHRLKESPETVLTELDRFEATRDGRFSRDSADWIQNNLVGAILYVYGTLREPCPLYAGLDTLITVSKGNIRHLLELCKRAFESLEVSSIAELPSIEIARQAEVVRETGHALLGEIRGAGKSGNQLHALALTLGAIFRQRQRLPEQSEPEVNHFTITGDRIRDDLEVYLKEAVKWSVLFEEKQTKLKATGFKGLDYILNPIYAGHFHISFRKRRAIRFSDEELMVMFDGRVEAKDRLVQRRGGTDDSSATMALDFGGSDG